MSSSRKEKKEKTDEEEEEIGRGEEKNMSEQTTNAEKQKLTEQPEKSCELKQKENVQSYTPAVPFPRGFRKQGGKSNFLNSWKYLRK